MTRGAVGGQAFGQCHRGVAGPFGSHIECNGTTAQMAVGNSPKRRAYRANSLDLVDFQERQGVQVARQIESES